MSSQVGHDSEPSSSGDENVHCTKCGEKYYSESSGIIHCSCCEESYCQGCFWGILPKSYKEEHHPVISEDEFDDAVCDWCKWDVTWKDKTIAALMAQDRKTSKHASK